MIFCLCRLFGENILLILTTLPYNSNSAIQGGCQLLLKLSIAYFYVYCICVESLHYKVLIFYLCESFCGNSLLVLTTLPYTSNSAIQGGCQLLLKLSINNLYMYCIFVESLRYKVLMFYLGGSFGENSLMILSTLSYNMNSDIQGVCQLLLKIYIIPLYEYLIFV